MQKFGLYVLGIIVLSFIIFVVGATLLGGTETPYTDFMLTVIAVYLVTSKFKISNNEE